MPIIEQPGEPRQFRQGDILEGIRLSCTARSWIDGGTPEKVPYKLCMVLSRPCVLEHKREVLVAGVEKYEGGVPKGIDSFEEVLDFLRTVRDGAETPDLFYLGQIPGRKGRFCARLDAIFSIQKPPDDKLPEFLIERRIGSLSVEFVRDLHLRVFASFASLGFNDQRWLSDDDLAWLVAAGRKDIAAADAAVNDKRSKAARLKAEGKDISEREVSDAESRLNCVKARVQPYLDEHERRWRSSEEA